MFGFVTAFDLFYGVEDSLKDAPKAPPRCSRCGRYYREYDPRRPLPGLPRDRHHYHKPHLHERPFSDNPWEGSDDPDREDREMGDIDR